MWQRLWRGVPTGPAPPLEEAAALGRSPLRRFWRFSVSKPFKSITQQIELLETRGVQTDDNTAAILRREGYYPIVNGYKAPFIDETKTAEEGDDRYVAGTKFSDIHGLFTFDRNLRELTFHYLIRVEALVKTACAYCFSEKHGAHDAYLQLGSYATETEYAAFGLNDYGKNLVKLISTLEYKSKDKRSEFISHYQTKYGEVPLWVLVNDLTFGNIQHFFNLMKPAKQRAVCKHIALATGMGGSSTLGYFDPTEAKASIDYLVKFRNNCAHDDRLYCARVGPHHECGYAMMLVRIERFLPETEYKDMLDGIIQLLNVSAATSPVMRHLIGNMGFDMQTKEDRVVVRLPNS